MGGKLFPGSKRLIRSDYLKESFRISNLISDILQTRVIVPPQIRQKLDFGDIDTVVVLPDGVTISNYRKILVDRIPLEKHHTNGNVFSFFDTVSSVQVDLMFFDYKDWNTAVDFNSFGEYGNLVGKLAHTFGMKYSTSGLRYVYYYNNAKMCDIILTRETRRILEFLGLSYEKFSKGFDTDIELFEFIINSEYFNIDIFLPSFQNSVTRGRDKTRPIYWKFIDWLKTEKGYDTDIDPILTYRNITSEQWKRIDKFFPESKFYEKISNVLEKENRKKKIAERWNGKILIEKYKDFFDNDRMHLRKVMAEFVEHIELREITFERYALMVKDVKFWSDFDNWYTSKYLSK